MVECGEGGGVMLYCYYYVYQCCICTIQAINSSFYFNLGSSIFNLGMSGTCSSQASPLKLCG